MYKFILLVALVIGICLLRKFLKDRASPIDNNEDWTSLNNPLYSRYLWERAHKPYLN